MSTKTTARNKPRLGRGLSSLISIAEVPIQIELSSPPEQQGLATTMPDIPPAPPAPKTSGSDIAHLPVAEIRPNPHQPRHNFDEKGLADLAASIKSTGLIQPIIVRQIGSEYELIAGERRLRAAKQAGLTSIPCLIRNVDAVTQAQMALIENIQREDLNAIDRALGYRTLIDQLGLTQAELATRLGEERSSVANYLRLLELAEPVKAMVKDGHLSLGHAKLIAGVADILEQERLANLVILRCLTVRALEKAIADGPEPAPHQPEPTGAQAHLKDLEKTITRQLGLRVSLRASARKGKGKLIIHYASLDQFDELLSRLGCTAEV
ncbi:MAG: ParB/RepB/Spo0J family partition protein [Tepidisphaeraceae bacterium]|jgi:ParB family chromosome partitioning protein